MKKVKQANQASDPTNTIVIDNPLGQPPYIINWPVRDRVEWKISIQQKVLRTPYYTNIYSVHIFFLSRGSNGNQKFCDYNTVILREGRNSAVIHNVLYTCTVPENPQSSISFLEEIIMSFVTTYIVWQVNFINTSLIQCNNNTCFSLHKMLTGYEIPVNPAIRLVSSSIVSEISASQRYLPELALSLSYGVLCYGLLLYSARRME